MRWLVVVVAAGCGGESARLGPDASTVVDVVPDATSDAGPKPFGFTYVKAAETDAYMELGRSVAISADGNTIAAGALISPGGEPRAGAVYVFVRSGGTWAQHAIVTAMNAGAGDEFGASVALSADGTTLAVGAIHEDSADVGIGGDGADDDASNSGAVYVFVRSGSSWNQQAYIKAASTTGYNVHLPDTFGQTIALAADGNTLAVGSIGDDSNATGVGGSPADDSRQDSGAAYVFTRSGGTWSQQAYLKALHPDQGDLFGLRLALSGDGNTLAVTSFDEASGSAGVDGDQTDNSMLGSGAAYVFTRTGTNWSQAAFLKASNPFNGDHFGIGLAMSSDGSTIAVGANGESSDAIGVGGPQDNDNRSSSGAVYVFARSVTMWEQQAYVKGMHPLPGDKFGAAIALSATGDALAVASNHGKAEGVDPLIDPADNSVLIGGGAVDWYVRAGTSWTSLHYVRPNYPTTEDFFGSALAFSTDAKTLAIGSPGDDSSATGVDGDQQTNLGYDRGALFILE